MCHSLRQDVLYVNLFTELVKLLMEKSCGRKLICLPVGLCICCNFISNEFLECEIYFSTYFAASSIDHFRIIRFVSRGSPRLIRLTGVFMFTLQLTAPRAKKHWI